MTERRRRSVILSAARRISGARCVHPERRAKRSRGPQCVHPGRCAKDIRPSPLPMGREAAEAERTRDRGEVKEVGRDYRSLVKDLIQRVLTGLWNSSSGSSTFLLIALGESAVESSTAWVLNRTVSSKFTISDSGCAIASDGGASRDPDSTGRSRTTPTTQ